MGTEVCFVIMPFSSPHGSEYTVDHFTEVYEDLFVPAIEEAGFRPLRADTTVLSRHILADLLTTIEEASIILCDLSAANPNVLFELGWAFRADRPCALVKDDLTKYPFDLQHTHVTTYHSSLKARLVKDDIRLISQLIRNTAGDATRRWSLVRSLGLETKLRVEAATQEDSVAAAILDMREELSFLRSILENRSSGETLPAGEGRTLSNWYGTPNQSQKRDEILAVLEEERGDVGRAARRIGVTRSKLYSLIKALDIALAQTRG